jgi:hypothetical protein
MAELDIPITVTGLQGRPIATTAPADGQALCWSASGQTWTPLTPPFLPLSGGSITGGLTVAGNTTVGANFGVNGTTTSQGMIQANAGITCGSGSPYQVYLYNGTQPDWMIGADYGNSHDFFISGGSPTTAGFQMDLGLNCTINRTLTINNSAATPPGTALAINTSGGNNAAISLVAAGAVWQLSVNGGNGYFNINGGPSGGSVSTLMAVNAATGSAAFPNYLQVGGNGIMYTQYASNNIGFHWGVGSPSGLGMYIDNIYQGVIQTGASDLLFKENVKEATEDALALLGRIELISFDMPDRISPEKSAFHFEIGFSANQLEEVMPDCVNVASGVGPNGEDIRSVDLMPMTARCVRAIQQLVQRVEALEHRRSRRG